MFKKIILSITFSIGFMFACSEGDDLDNSQNESFDRGSLQTNLADNIIIPAYQDLSQQLGLLVSAKENFIANSNQENLEILRNNLRPNLSKNEIVLILLKNLFPCNNFVLLKVK